MARTNVCYVSGPMYGDFSVITKTGGNYLGERYVGGELECAVEMSAGQVAELEHQVRMLAVAMTRELVSVCGARMAIQVLDKRGWSKMRDNERSALVVAAVAGALAGKTAEDTLGARLRQARIRAGFSTVERVAGLLGVAKNTLVRYESGEAAPDGHLLAAMVQLYACDTDHLVCGREYPKISLEEAEAIVGRKKGSESKMQVRLVTADDLFG